MTQEIIALVLVVLISMILPLVVLGILIKKEKEQWKKTIAAFISGGIIYIVMQWGIKEHGLVWLFNNTGFGTFMNQHYISYLLVVAFIGVLLAIIAQMCVVILPFKKRFSFVKAIAFGLGYATLESVLLIGLKSINTIIELAKGNDLELGTTTVELLLSGYERILMVVIEIAIVVAMIYFIEQGMAVRGGVIAVFCHTLVTFLPGFLIAFSLSDYYEVYSRTVALILVYVVLTASALAAVVVLNAFKYQLKE